jgi:hypothetical protein
MKEILRLDARQLERMEGLYAAYRRMSTSPEASRPMVIVRVPARGMPGYRERFRDPLAMLAVELEALRNHLEVGDDHVPAVRVQFGTGLIASAFGCETFVPDDELPCIRGPVLAERDAIAGLRQPSTTAGLLGRLAEFTRVFRRHLPEGVHVQHPDIQSPFNTAYAIRGNDLFLDLVDDPPSADALLDVITDFMIAVVPRLKATVSGDRQWFFDMGVLWKGTARISNCSTTMIDPRMYERFVLPRDRRLFRAIGGGRVHYCGTSAPVISCFLGIPGLSGLDYDPKLHDLWSMCEMVPANVVLLQSVEVGSATWRRLVAGDWPKKRNLVIETAAEDVATGKDLLEALKRSMPA